MAAAATTYWGRRTPARVLVASPDPKVRQRVLGDPQWDSVETMEAFGGAHVLAKLRETLCDGVLLDRNLPDLDASEVAELIRREHPQVNVSWIDNAPTSQDEDHVSSTQLTPGALAPHAVRSLECSPSSALPGALPGMIGDSSAMQQVYRLARMVAGRDTTVLITGETGTGKELVAEAIHALSPRAKQPFVIVNCAAIPEALLEAELFGHARGAFTGAVQSRQGRIHVAQGGTLFLDEIGELPLGMQAKILRFLQSGEVQRLGSADVHHVDVRVICATNAPLHALVTAKQFRRDLYYRMAVFPIALPPLRDRSGDIERLAQHFLDRLCAQTEFAAKNLSEAVLALLRERAWPGNVRELEHALERAFILSGEETELRPEHFPCYECDCDATEN